jgi:hypothetical protein
VWGGSRCGGRRNVRRPDRPGGRGPMVEDVAHCLDAVVSGDRTGVPPFCASGAEVRRSARPDAILDGLQREYITLGQAVIACAWTRRSRYARDGRISTGSRLITLYVTASTSGSPPSSRTLTGIRWYAHPAPSFRSRAAKLSSSSSYKAPRTLMPRVGTTSATPVPERIERRVNARR